MSGLLWEDCSDPVYDTYFVQSVGGGLIKIGRAIDPWKRLKHLNTCSPEELRLLAIMDGEDWPEACVHAQFARDRVRGEWFHPSDRLLKFIAKHGVNPDYRDQFRKGHS